MINFACHSIVYHECENVVYVRLEQAETMYLFSIHAKFNATNSLYPITIEQFRQAGNISLEFG